ncbi:MAG: NAD(P)-dependent alcohol dehydrogenase [Myxococcota bacterium]
MQVHAFAALSRGADLTPLTYDLPDPRDEDCIVAVSSCGICHSDIHMIDNDWRMTRYPLVPGHEVVGTIVTTGRSVTHLKKGDRVGIGWQRGACLHCPDCLGGNENLCDHSDGLIVGHHGGFADHVMVDARFAFPLPAGLATDSAGPLLCGGATVYSALRHAGMGSGANIGVLGIGGLGHLAVQFASRLGNRVTVFTTSPDKAKLAMNLGAYDAVVVPTGGAPPRGAYRLDILVSTVPHVSDWRGYIDTLASDGTLVFVAVPPKTIELNVGWLLEKRRRIMASPIGGRAIITEMLATAERFGIEPVIETFPMASVNEALARVRKNEVRYRAVLMR